MVTWKKLTCGSDSVIYVSSDGKLIKKQFIGDDDWKKATCVHEMEVYNRLKAANVPHIMTYHQACLQKAYITMDYKPYDLESVIVKKKMCPTDHKNKEKIIKQVHAFLKACHDAGVSHNDFKAKNILVDANFNIFVSDFDLSNYGDKVDIYDDYQKLIVMLLQIKNNMGYTNVYNRLVGTGLFEREEEEKE